MPSTQKIEIRPELMQTLESNKTLGLLYYEATMEEFVKYENEQKGWNEQTENLRTRINNLEIANNELQAFKNDQKNVWNGHVTNFMTWINNLQNDYNAFKNDQKTVWDVHVQNLMTWINNLQNAHNEHKIKIHHLIECSHALGHCVHLPKLPV
uniref:Uncharacterized protein n=1 Tax=Panagrolaimus davidi TaxID=227884 RepID=A0A914QKI7_9BILA